MGIGRRRLLLVFFLTCICFEPACEFYIPGVAPVDFTRNARVDVKAIKLTSVKTHIPYDYYTLPFCYPKGGKSYRSENLGEVLRGDRVVNSPYEIRMLEDVVCRTLCAKKTLTKEESNKLIKRIKEDYRVHLLIDNLPCVTVLPNFGGGENSGMVYEHGYSLGVVAKSGKVYLHNHLEITLKYHQLKTSGLDEQDDQYRVVGFEVMPISVDKSEIKLNKHTDGVCMPKSSATVDQKKSPQEIRPDEENGIYWTYSVKWDSSNIRWASRWDSYLAMKDVHIHWFSIVNSLIVVICLSGFLSVIIVRTVRRDIANYNRDEELDEALEESGWKLVHGDVFRPPVCSKLFTSLIGSGIQIFGMVLITLSFAMLGMLSPSSRGSLLSAALFLFCFMGLVSGYYSGRLYKTMKGVQWKQAAFQTGFLFPAIVLFVCFLMNFVLIGKHSSGAVPFTTMIALLLMWFGIDMPLVFLGFYFGYRKQPHAHPVRTNQIPRQVPEQPWYLATIPSLLMAGILPFGAMFIELFFVFSALWENQFYYLFGFLFLAFLILVISCAQISIVASYFQLCCENYHWWWKSFVTSGGSAFYVFGYSLFYYMTKLEIVGFVPALLYFTYSALMALGFWLLTGTIGFYSAYWFVCKIYGAVKID